MSSHTLFVIRRKLAFILGALLMVTALLIAPGWSSAESTSVPAPDLLRSSDERRSPGLDKSSEVTTQIPARTIILNTGYDQANLTRIAEGQQDNEWRVMQSSPDDPPPPPPATGRPADVVNDAVWLFHNSSLPANFPNSRWISFAAHAGQGPSIVAPYKYAFYFTLPVGVSSPQLNLKLSADDHITEVTLNNCLPLFTGSGGIFANKNPLVLSSALTCFNSGSNVNVLTVTVGNTVGGSITGLIVDGTVTYEDCDRLPIREIPNLTSITFWESTFAAPTQHKFGKDDRELRERLSGPLTTGNSDFESLPGTESYDVFYSTWDGTFDADGQFVTIEADLNKTAPAGGGLNLARVDFNGTGQFATSVSSFVALGNNAMPNDVGKAVDVDPSALTDTTMGNTIGQEQRLRVTVGFPCLCSPPPSGMVAWWPGDANPIDIKDGNNGKLEGGVTYAPGKVNQAFSFPSLSSPGSDRVGLTSAPSANTFTIEAWVFANQHGPSGYRTIYADNFRGFWLKSGKLNWWQGGDRFVGNTAVPLGAWHHIALTYSNGTFTGYLNGAADGTSFFPGESLPTGTGLGIGGHSNFVPEDFDGLIDELRIYDRALDPAEIQGIFNAGSAGNCKCAPPPSGMVAWYPLDELPGATVVHDIAGFPDDGLPKPGPQVGSVQSPVALPGMVSGALDFVSPGHVQVSNHPDLNFSASESLTIDAWIKPPLNPLFGFINWGIVSKVSGNSGYALLLPGSPRNILRFWMNGTTFNSTAAMTFNQWHHVAVTVDRTTDEVTLYIDGVSEVFSPTPPGAASNSAPLLIGRSQVPGAAKGHVVIDEVEIFKRALEPKEVEAIFNAGSAGKCRQGPKLEIKKGLVATNNPNGVFSPALPSGKWKPFGASCPAFNGTIDSSNLDGLINSNLNNVDPGDMVTFAIAVENTGNSPAYEIELADIFPLDEVDLPRCYGPNFSGLCLTDGSGTPIPFTTESAGRSRVRIVLAPGFSLAAGSPSNTTGTNIAIITINAQLLDSAYLKQGGCCGNQAQLLHYTSQPGGPALVDENQAPPPSDSATFCFRTTLEKPIVATSEVHTTPQTAPPGSPRVTIGEIVRYRLVVRLPEDLNFSFRVTDMLAPGMRFLNDGSAGLALISNSDGVVQSPAFGTAFNVSGNESSLPSLTLDSSQAIPISAITSGSSCGDPVTFDLGDIFNSDRDSDFEFVVIEFNALVCNVEGNQNGTTLSNTFNVSVNNGSPVTSPPINVSVVEPNLKIFKTVSPATIFEGGTVDYRITITNSGSADAFDVQFADTLPSGLTFVPFSVSGTGNCLPFWGASTGAPLVACARVPANGVLTINYKAVAKPATCPVVLTNQAKVTWTSLPESQGTITNSTLSSTPGNSGAANGERNGSTSPATLNDYTASASTPLSVTCHPCQPTPLGLFNTGVADNGSLLAGGDIDPHYSLILPNGNTSSAQVLAPAPSGFVPNNATSKWIGPGNGFQPTGVYTYRVSFTLTDCEPESVAINGRWASDNQAVIRVNGLDTNFTTRNDGFKSFSEFVLDQSTASFRPGLNTLDFVVTNNELNTGLRVEVRGSVTCCTCVTAASGLLNWWPFDETSGTTTAQDIRGLTKNVGTHMNGPTPVTGIVGGALLFDGANDFVEVADSPEVNFSGSCPDVSDPPPNAEPLTIDVWVKTNLAANQLGPNSGLLTILDKRVNPRNPRGYVLFLFNGRLGFQINGKNFVAPVNSRNVADNLWHFVAVSLQTCAINGGKLYVDGSPVMATPGTDGLANTAKLFIGQRNPVFDSNFFRGTLDELEIFKRSLSDDEVRTLFEARSGGKCFRQPCPTITINPATLVNQKWELGVDYPPFQLTATGGTGPYIFTAGVSVWGTSPTVLPPGMFVSADGTVQGRPILVGGSHTFIVTVEDAKGCLGAREYHLTICSPITLSPAAGALPAPVINTHYSEVFEATGGCAEPHKSSFTYSLTSGALPTGLRLDADNGELWGTATQAGSYDFTVTATDTCGCSHSQTYTLTANVRKGEFTFTRGMNEFCIWGGGGPFNTPNQIDNPNSQLPGSVHLPRPIVETSGGSFSTIGLCYGRILWANDKFAFKYSFNAIPVAVLSYRDVNRDLGIPVPGSETRRNVFGTGLSPIGLQLYFRQQSRVKPFVNTSGGFIFFNDPVPQLNGARFNFTYDFGGGVQVFRDSRRAFTFGYKYQRLSNGSRALNNRGFDGNLFYFGYSIFNRQKERTR